MQIQSFGKISGIEFQVLRVYAKKRIGEDNFITSIRHSLEDAYKDKLVGNEKLEYWINGLYLLYCTNDF